MGSLGISSAMVLLIKVVLATPDILEPLPAVPQDTFEEELDMKTSETMAPAPIALPLASPERSSVDEEHFNMAASYLKSQFSIPHHVVPSFEDTASWWPHVAQDRIRRLPNLQNHQLDSDSDSSSSDYEYIDTSNEFQVEEDKRYKRRPDLDYAWAQEKEPGKKVYRNKKHRIEESFKSKPPHKPMWARKRPKQKPNTTKNKPRFPRNPSQYQTPRGVAALPGSKVPRNFLAAMTSQLRHSITNALTGTRRQTVYPLGVKAGYLRKHLALGRSHMFEDRKPKLGTSEIREDRILEKEKTNSWIPYNRIPDNRIPDNRIPDKRILDNRINVKRISDNRYNRFPDKWNSSGRERPRISSLATRPSRGVLAVSPPDRVHKSTRGHTQGREKKKKKRKRRRKGPAPGVVVQHGQDVGAEEQDLGGSISRQDDSQQERTEGHSGNYFDGLEMDFWEDEVKVATKPDYRTRWNDLNSFYEEDGDMADEVNTKEHIGSRRQYEEEDKEAGKENKGTEMYKDGSNGWGEKMWKEIEDDWSKAGEKWKKYKVRKRKKEKPSETVIDEGARYLSAWADAGQILEPKSRLSVEASGEEKLSPPGPNDQQEEERNSEEEMVTKEEYEKSSYKKKKVVKLPFPAKPLQRRPIRTRKHINQSSQ